MSTNSKRLGRRFFFGCLCAFLLCACGHGEESASQNRSSSSGGYSATLVFPNDLPRLNTPAKALSSVDCEAAGIDKIEFNFVLKGKQYGPHSFGCELGRASISTAPAGTGVIVEVYAEDAAGNAILQGSETVNIAAGRETTGGAIAMAYVPGHNAVPADAKNRFGMGFNLIRKGAFDMGSPPGETGRSTTEGRETQHHVTLTEDFYMQTTEVTQAQWQAVVQAAKDVGITTTLSLTPSYFYRCGPNCPVERVTWEDIDQFLDILGQLEEDDYRLPTEAQWEYAARARSITAFANGNMNSATDDCYPDTNLAAMGWYCNNSKSTTHPVGRLQPNAWKLYDMHGNVREWVADSYADYSSGDVEDPFVDIEGSYRVLRGGSWYLNAQYCRSAQRYFNTPDYRSSDFGFRLVCLQRP